MKIPTAIIVFLPLALAAGCASAMTAGDAVAVLNREYDPQLSRAPDERAVERARRFFLSHPDTAKESLLPLADGSNRLLTIFALSVLPEALPGDADVTAAAGNLTGVKSHSIRLAAAEALALAHDPDSVRLLVPFLHDKRASYRVRALFALVRSDDAGAIGEMKKLLDDREPVTLHLPVKKYFAWIISWQSREFVEMQVCEVALACISKLSGRDFGWRPGDDYERFRTAAERARRYTDE